MSKTDGEKLQIKLKHWIEHNQEHAQEFKEWAEKARNLAENDACNDILGASQEMDRANESLRQALRKLEKKGSP